MPTTPVAGESQVLKIKVYFVQKQNEDKFSDLDLVE